MRPWELEGSRKNLNPLCDQSPAGSIPGLERASGEGTGNPLQYSCLGNPLEGAGWAIVHGVAKESDMT